MSILQRVALIVTIIGAVNWGLIGLFKYDLVASIFSDGNQLEVIPRVIYTIVGLSGLICLSALFKPDHEFVERGEKEPRTDI